MGQETVQNITAQKKATNALQKVEFIETTLFGQGEGEGRRPGFIQLVSGDLYKIQSAMENFAQGLRKAETHASEIVDVVNVLVDLLGKDTVEAKVKEAVLARAEAQAENDRKTIAEGLEKKTIIVSDTITENSIVTGYETTPTGEKAPPGFFALQMSTVFPEVKEALLGKQVGASVKGRNNDNVFTVEAIYNFNPNPPKSAEVAAPADAAPAGDLKVESDNEVFAPSITVGSPKES